MNIDDFVRNQIKKAHDSMFGDLLRSNKSFDVRYISAYLLFSQRIKGQIGDHDGVSVNDIKSIFVSCLNIFFLYLKSLRIRSSPLIP